MGLFGDLVAVGFGGPPKMKDWVPLDAQSEQQRAIAGNQAAMPAATKLGSQIDTYNQGEIQRMLELAMPGYAKLRDLGTSTVTDLMAGKVPGDVANAISTNAAARSAYGGFGGTGMSKNLTARDLGLTSLDLMTKGLDSANRWISMARTLAPTFDISSMFLSPGQQLSFATNERNNKLSYTNTKAQFDYATDPMRAVEKDVGGIADAIGTALSMYMGGGLGGDGGLGGMMGGGEGGGLGGIMGGGGGGAAAGGAAGGGFSNIFGGLMGLGSGGGVGSASQMVGGFGSLFSPTYTVAGSGNSYGSLNFNNKSGFWE